MSNADAPEADDYGFLDDLDREDEAIIEGAIGDRIADASPEDVAAAEDREIERLTAEP